MSAESDPFDRVRTESDPLRQARMAGELISIYQQRSVELARLRKEAINRAAAEQGMSYSAIASKLGLTRGRVTQIRQTAPATAREFFGVGPVTVAVPLRSMPGRSLPMISSEDSEAADRLDKLLTGLAFQVERYGIPPDGAWHPTGDVIAVCGPKNSPVTDRALETDPYLAFHQGEHGQWTIRERDGSRVYESPMDHDLPSTSDVAYIGRVALEDQTLLIIAGIHAIGSVGAVDYLSANLDDLYSQVGPKRWSAVIGNDHENGTIVRSYLVCPPRVHD